ncbi:hypothetical protein MCEMIEM28_01336 [Burkholderiaceae bacterium]
MLQPFILFDLVSTAEHSHIVFRDGTRRRVPFAAQDLELIFLKMGFEVKVEQQAMQRHAKAYAFKVYFDQG